MIKPRPVAVGAFLLAALALLVGGILFFTAGTPDRQALANGELLPGDGRRAAGRLDGHLPGRPASAR